MGQELLSIIGARENNLKDVSIDIPKDKLVVVTGLSGSGKSSLAFDTVFAEGQRRYLETFPNYIRQFLGTLERPDVDEIRGLSPVISIEQKTSGWNPRSTVGTVTEVYDFLRLLYSRAGDAYSYLSGEKMVKFSQDQIIDYVLNKYSGEKAIILAPLVRGRKGHYRELFDQMRKLGYTKMRIDGEIIELVPQMQVERYKVHDIELVVDRIKIDSSKEDRISQSISLALDMGSDFFILHLVDKEEDNVFSKNLMDPTTGLSYEEPSPNNFSFNSPYGACQGCNGMGKRYDIDLKKVIPDDNLSIQEVGIVPLGEVRQTQNFSYLRKHAKKEGFNFKTPIKDIPASSVERIIYGKNGKENWRHNQLENDYSYKILDTGIAAMLIHWFENSSSTKIKTWAESFLKIDSCPDCNGTRLRKESLHFKIGEKNIAELAEMDLEDLHNWFQDVDSRMSERQLTIAKDVLKEVRYRLEFLVRVGLHYLHLNRPARTLSGGEAQRTRLATQIGSQLTGITYILDEPSIGLHQRDNERLIQSIRELTDIGNSVIVVEHDRDIMLASDFLIDLGPGAGVNGGQIVASGTIDEVSKLNTTTAQFLNGKSSISIPKKRRAGNGNFLELKGASGNNLKSVNIKIPLGTMIMVTGVSGSGKSTLINRTLYPILRQHFYNSVKNPLPFQSIKGLEHLDKVIEIDQSPIGRTPRSNPATYTKMFDIIRRLYSDLPESKIRGYKPGQFSFNVVGGRCETCKGGGQKKIEMTFLPDVYVDCDACNGQRYTRETLEILYKGKSINDVLNMSVEEAKDFFDSIPKIKRICSVLSDVGLGYITLGQPATTLSGGEAQRVKLSLELSKRDSGNTFYILDEPTTGLHFQDISFLLSVLQRLVDKGNTVLVIEHNMDMIKVGDYIIDIGPEGGKHGGEVVFQGTPEKLIKKNIGHTSRYLKMEMERN